VAPTDFIKTALGLQVEKDDVFHLPLPYPLYRLYRKSGATVVIAAQVVQYW
jgi:hypothetical protein